MQSTQNCLLFPTMPSIPICNNALFPKYDALKEMAGWAEVGKSSKEPQKSKPMQKSFPEL